MGLQSLHTAPLPEAGASEGVGGEGGLTDTQKLSLAARGQLSLKWGSLGGETFKLQLQQVSLSQGVKPVLTPSSELASLPDLGLQLVLWLVTQAGEWLEPRMY